MVSVWRKEDDQRNWHKRFIIIAESGKEKKKNIKMVLYKRDKKRLFFY